MNHLQRYFDADTGEETAESFAEQVLQAEDELIAQANALAGMRHSDGWKLVEDFCFSQIEAGKDKLVDAKDIETIRLLQSRVSAFSDLLGAVLKLIEEGKSLQEDAARQPHNP